MIAENLHDFFVAAASVAGALIGLLFVAISVGGERLAANPDERVNRIRAHAALTTFLNSLIVSMFALIPTNSLGAATEVVAVVGLMVVLGSTLSLLQRSRTWSNLRDAAFLLALLAVLVRELVAGLALRSHPHDAGAAQTMAALVVLCFVLGICRSWELIGAPSSISVGHETARLLREGVGRSGEPDTHHHQQQQQQ